MSRILVIDEDPRVLALVHLMLEDLGHEVIVANNFREGVMLYMIWQPVNLVMTDIFMADRRGFDLLARMIQRGQEQEQYPWTATKAVSGNCRIHNETVMLGMVRRLKVAEVMDRSSYCRAFRSKLEMVLLSAGGCENRRPISIHGKPTFNQGLSNERQIN